MVRAWDVFWPAYGLWLALLLPFLDFDEGPKPAIEEIQGYILAIAIVFLASIT